MTRANVRTLCAIGCVVFLALWFLPEGRAVGFTAADCVICEVALLCCLMLASVEDWG